MRRDKKPKIALQARLQSVMENALECVLEDYLGLFTVAHDVSDVAAVESSDDIGESASEKTGLLNRHKNAKVILSHLELLLKLYDNHGKRDTGGEDDGDYKKRLILQARNSLQSGERD